MRDANCSRFLPKAIATSLENIWSDPLANNFLILLAPMTANGRPIVEFEPSAQLTTEESLDLFIELRTQSGHLALGDPGHPQRLHKVIDFARRGAVHVRLLDHRHQPALTPCAALESSGSSRPSVASGSSAPTSPGAPQTPVAIAFALVYPLRAALVSTRATARLGHRFDQPLPHKLTQFRHKSPSAYFSPNSPSAILSLVIVVFLRLW